MEVQNENARKFYSTIAVAREAYGAGRPIGKVDSLFSVAMSHYFRTPEGSRVPAMRKEIDSLEINISNWRDEE